MDSIFHQDCPLVTDHVRGDLHAAYLISPPKYEDEDDAGGSECLLTLIAQMDPKGWVWKAHGYQRKMLQQLLMHLIDIRDTIDAERFVQVHFDPTAELLPSATNHAVATANAAAAAAAAGTTENGGGNQLASIPPPLCNPLNWAEPDHGSFKVRGANYNKDKVKCSSAPYMFKLIAVDVFDVPEPTFNISSHPRNRVAMARARGEDFWVFVVNIMVPGPPFLSFVCYMEGDKKAIEADTPFGRIAKPFFFGSDDEFRNNRFKLIPKVVCIYIFIIWI